ncbi:alkanal monooxygenase, partial [Motilibacter sp. E257]|nr:alkanal monooxygenase [Motilibacter deserti]
RTGRLGPIATPEEAAAYPWTDAERDLLARWPSQPVVGTPEQVVAELDALLARTGADELMLATSAHSPQDRARTLELVAHAWAQPAADAA